MNAEKGMTAEEKLYMDLMSIIHYATEKAQALKHINQFKESVCNEFANWIDTEYKNYIIGTPSISDLLEEFNQLKDKP